MIGLENKFNEIVTDIAETEKVNPTLLFSKKNQKEFIRLALSRGPEEALNDLTGWRRELFRDPLDKVLLSY